MRKRLTASAALLAIGVGIYVLGRYLYRMGLSWSGQFSGVLSLFLALFAMVNPFLGKMLRWLKSAQPVVTRALLNEMADNIAIGGLRLKDQERDRNVHDPWPLPVQWKLAGRPSSGVQGATRAAEHIPSEGSFDNIDDLFSALVRPHRLVVLGEAGAGKSVLLARLALRLLERRSAGERAPLPVLISLGEWDPNSQPLDEYAASQIARQQPRLANNMDSSAAQASTLARYFIKEARPILMLDGFDEIAEKLQAEALNQINKWGSHEPLIVTSHAKPYWDAVDTLRRGITDAEVVELQPLDAQAAEKYLAEAAPGNFTDRWKEVFAHIDQDRTGPLAQVLGVPLMIWLARKVYGSTDTRPSELVELFTHGSRSLIEEHLLRRFIPAAYESRGGKFRISEKRAERSLRFLARHLQQEGTENFAWWDLNRRVPRAYYALNGGFPMGVPIGMVVLIVVGVRVGLAPGIEYAVAAGLAVSLLAGIPGSPASWRRIIPATIKIRSLRSPGLIRRLALGIGTGITVGLIAGLPAGLVYGPFYGLLVGLGIGPAIGIALSLRQLFDVSADIPRAVSPKSVLRDDRRSALIQASVAGIGLGIGTGIAIALTLRFGTTASVSIGIGYALAYGAAVGLGIRATHLTTPAFSTYFWGQVWLAATGRLPFRLMAFLEDAHERGILRQQGAVYQFRHKSLQDYLEGR